jgi:hypothetical protein
MAPVSLLSALSAPIEMKSCVSRTSCSQVSCLTVGTLDGGMPPSSSLVGPPASCAGSWYRMTRYLLVTRNPVSQKNMRCTVQTEASVGCWSRPQRVATECCNSGSAVTATVLRCLKPPLRLRHSLSCSCDDMLCTCLGRGKTPKLLGPRRRTCFSNAAIIFFPSPCLCVLNGVELRITAPDAVIAPGEVLMLKFLRLTMHRVVVTTWRSGCTMMSQTRAAKTPSEIALPLQQKTCRSAADSWCFAVCMPHASVGQWRRPCGGDCAPCESY